MGMLVLGRGEMSVMEDTHLYHLLLCLQGPYVLNTFLFYRWRNGGTEKLSDLATVTSWGGPGKA